MAFINIPGKDNNTTLSPDEFNYFVNKVNSLKLAILQGSGFVGSLRISDVPDIDGWYFASEAGTYINAGNIPVELVGHLNVIIVSNFGTTFSLVKTPIPHVGGLNLQGSWDASTNTPDISISPEVNSYWITNVAGATTLGSETYFNQADWAVYTVNGWIRINAISGDVNVQSDWNSVAGDSLILNKPTIPSGNQIIDWTVDNGATVINPGNYTDTNTQLSDAEIAALGYIKIDTNTQRSDLEIQSIIDANDAGFITSYIDTNTQLTDSDIAALGYIKTYIDTTYVSSDFNHNSLTGVSADEHIDWTLTNVKNIHADNYTDTIYDSITVDTHIANVTTNPHNVTKINVGLGNVDNTSDANKPVSTATQTALDNKVDDTQVLTNVPSGAIFIDTTYVSSDFNHDLLSGFVPAEHIDWAGASTGTIHITNLPATAITSVQLAATELAMLALTAQEGDVVVRSDENQTYMHNGGIAGTMADFTELATPTSDVTSVDGQTGAVVLNHDTLLGFVANEHIDWTIDQGATNVHAGNYIDTKYTNVSEFINDAGYLLNTTDVMSGLLRLDGGLHVDTNNNINNLVISRVGTSEQSVSIGVDDGTAYFNYTQDEANSSFRFNITNTDAEAGGGVNANTGYIDFINNTLGTFIKINGAASSTNWDTAFGWGDHGLSAQDKIDIGNLSGTNTGDQILTGLDYAATNHTHTFASLTSKPTTISGYGITDGIVTTDSRLSDARTPTLTGNLLTAVPSGALFTDTKYTNVSEFINDAGYTGDQDLSGYLPLTAGSSKPLTGNLHIEHASTPRISLTDTTNNLVGQVTVGDSYMYFKLDNGNTVVSSRMVHQIDGAEVFHIKTGGDGVFAGSVSATDGNFSGNVTATGNISAPNLLLSNSDTDLILGQVTSAIEFIQNDLSAGATGITGKILMVSAEKTGQGAYYGNSADMQFRVAASGTSASDNASLTAMHIQNGTGNVGIGTTSPSTRLEVAASATTSVDIAHFSNSNDVVKIKHSLDVLGSGLTSIYDASNNEDIRLSAQSDSWFNAGNVGIGTISPDAKLDIEGDFEAVYALKFTNTKGTGNVYGFRSHGANGEDLSLYHGANRVQGWNELGESFFEGNVGIGTTSPDAKLEIESTTNPVFRISNGGGTSPNPKIELYRQTGVSGNIQYSAANKVMILENESALGGFDFDIAGNTKMAIDLNGNVTVTGTVLGSNLSGTNTGDQTLPTASSLGAVTITGTQTITGQKTFNTGGYNPLKLDRTGAANINMSFNHGGVLKGYLGVGSSETLTWGLNADSGQNDLIYHSGNRTLSGTNTGDQILTGLDYAATNHTHNVWDLASQRTSINIDTVGNNNFWGYTHGTQTNDGTHAGIYSYVASFGDKSQGIQLSHTFGGGNNGLWFRAGSDNNTSENGANVYKNWRRVVTTEDLSGYLLNTTDTLTGNLTVTGNIVSGSEIYTVGDILTIQSGGLSGTSITLNDTTGEITANGDISAYNLSGTNTGDQDLSGYLLNTTDTLTGDLTLTTPDTGGSPAMTNTTRLKGYAGRGIGIKIQDSVNSAVSPSNREWFIGSGYAQSGFNIGYDADGVQSSYTAQSKFSLSTAGNGVFAGTVLATNLSGTNTGDQTLTGLDYAATNHTHNYILSTDDRDVKPNTTGISSTIKAIKPFFTSLEGMTGSAGFNYQDLLVLDTWSGTSGGNVNAITLDKSDGSMRIWNAAQAATTWGTPKRVYTDDDFAISDYLPLAGGTLSGRLIIDVDVSGDGGWDNAGILLRNDGATPGEVSIAFDTVATGTDYWIQGLNQSNVMKWAYGTSFTNANARLELTDAGNLTATGTVLGSNLSGSNTGDQTAGTGIKLDSTGFRINGASIPSAADLDTYVTTGHFFQNSNSNTNSGSNYPVSRAGILTVTNDDYGNGNFTSQTYDEYASQSFWSRSLYNTIWTTWKDLSQDTTYDLSGYLTNNASDELRQDQNAATSLTIKNNTNGTAASSSLVLLSSGNNFVLSNYSDLFTGKLNVTEFKSTAGGSSFQFSPGNTTVMTLTSTAVTIDNLIVGSGSKIQFQNNDFIRYDDANGVGRFHFDSDGGVNNASVQAATFVGALDGTASNSSLLDSLDSTQFLRSDASDTCSGAISFSNTTASTSKITGAITVVGGVGVSGALYVGGDVVAYAASDKRLKNNIKPIENALDKVMSISGNTFDWNEELQDSHKGTDVGVVAQEIEAVLPEIVTTRDNGFLAVKYEKLVALLIESTKEQQAQIMEQDSKIKRLESLVEQMLNNK